MEHKIHQLTAIPLFSGISQDELRPMLRCIGGYIKKYPKGDYIIKDGDIVECLGVLFQGSVQMVKEDAWGGASLLVTIEKNQIFGETFVFSKTRQSTASFVALEGADVLYMPFCRILHTCEKSCRYHQTLITNIVEQIAKKNFQLIEKLEITAKKTLRGRILTYLFQQSQHVGKKHFVVPHGRLSMADYLCVDRSALTRELSRMKEEGIIEYDKNTFTLL